MQSFLPMILITNLFISHTNLMHLDQKANKNLKWLLQWFSANRLVIKADKTSCRLFTKNPVKNHTQPYRLNAHINSNTVKQVTNSKYLGVILDDRLFWKAQMSYTVD